MSSLAVIALWATVSAQPQDAIRVIVITPTGELVSPGYVRVFDSKFRVIKGPVDGTWPLDAGGETTITARQLGVTPGEKWLFYLVAYPENEDPERPRYLPSAIRHGRVTDFGEQFLRVLDPLGGATAFRWPGSGCVIDDCRCNTVCHTVTLQSRPDECQPTLQPMIPIPCSLPMRTIEGCCIGEAVLFR